MIRRAYRVGDWNILDLNTIRETKRRFSWYTYRTNDITTNDLRKLDWSTERFTNSFRMFSRLVVMFLQYSSSRFYIIVAHILSRAGEWPSGVLAGSVFASNASILNTHAPRPRVEHYHIVIVWYTRFTRRTNVENKIIEKTKRGRGVRRVEITRPAPGDTTTVDVRLRNRSVIQQCPGVLTGEYNNDV